MPLLSRTHARRHGLASAAALALIGSLFVLPSAEAAPAITPKDVAAAFHQAEALNEQVNQITVDSQQTQNQIDDITADIDHDLIGYNRQKSALGSAIVQQQMDAPLGPTVKLLSSDDPEAFLAGLGAVQALNSTRADALEQFGRSSKALKNRRAQLQDRQDQLTAAKKDAASKRAEIRAKYQKAKTQLAQLTAAQQAKVDGPKPEAGPNITVNVNASGRAKIAVDFALAQLGEPYVYGGAGPDSWDCSGLLMKAWAAAGVTIPRVVGPQMAAATSIPMSQLQPGDHVAYADMSHIGMYLGGGKVIHAPRPGRNVEITGLDGFSEAARVG
ncbi:C40 family peptidase [Aeromicrobium sp.]|uniref:C40 family peptidase n=1 Tax=Aeromicrobium sp. TaxID=1871063 RepID=UPI00198D8FB5|nr:C40 family peptidase [Aeromicrobium sp.]MBC7629978.1 C40 family peptidase [Aeromicrobium sp.]